MTYWHYTHLMQNESRLDFGYGVQMSDLDEFNFLRYHEKYPKASLLTICEISEEQYKALSEHITKLNSDGDNR